MIVSIVKPKIKKIICYDKMWFVAIYIRYNILFSLRIKYIVDKITNLTKSDAC